MSASIAQSKALKLTKLLLSAALFSFGWSTYMSSKRALSEAKEPSPSLWLQAGFDLFSASVGSLSFLFISFNVNAAVIMAPYLFSAILSVNIFQGAYLTASSLRASISHPQPEESTKHLKEAASQGFNLAINVLSIRVNNALLETVSYLATAMDFANEAFDLEFEEADSCLSSSAIIGTQLGGFIPAIASSRGCEAFSRGDPAFIANEKQELDCHGQTLRGLAMTATSQYKA